MPSDTNHSTSCVEPPSARLTHIRVLSSLHTTLTVGEKTHEYCELLLLLLLLLLL